MKRRKKNLHGQLIFIAIVIAVLATFNQLRDPSSDICANSISCIEDLSGKFEEQEKDAVFHGQKATGPANIAHVQQPSSVLGDTTADKRIELDLSSQKLMAFENGNQVFEFPVSTGKWYPTPTGEFKIWIKLRYTKMSGGDQSIGTYYYLPNVPYVMFFYNNQVSQARGFSIHGTYWHNNFGHPMSHGCVNMRTEDVEKLYYWATPVGDNTKGSIHANRDNPGTKVIVYGQAPKE